MSVLTTTYSMELTSSSTTEWASLFKKKAYKPASSTGKATLFLDQIHDEILPIEYIKLKTGKLEDRIMDDSKQFDLIGQVGNSNDCLSSALPEGKTIGQMISKYGILLPRANLKGSDQTNDKWRNDQQVKCNIVDCFTGTFMCPGPNNMLDSATRSTFVSFCKTMGIQPTKDTRLFISGRPEHYFFTSQHNCDLLLFCRIEQTIPPEISNNPQQLQDFINVTNFNYVWTEVINEVEQCITKDGYFTGAQAQGSSDTNAKTVKDWSNYYVIASGILRDISFTKIDVFSNTATWNVPPETEEYNWSVSQPACASNILILANSKLPLGKTILNNIKSMCSVVSRNTGDVSITDAGICAQKMLQFVDRKLKGNNDPVRNRKIKQAFIGLLKFLGDTSHIVFGRIIIEIKKYLKEPKTLPSFVDRLNKFKGVLSDGVAFIQADVGNVKTILEKLDVNFYTFERPLTTRLLLDSPQLLCNSIINIQHLTHLNDLYTPAEINSSNYLSVTADQEMIKAQYKTMLKLAVDTFIPYTGNSSVFDMVPPNNKILNLLTLSPQFAQALISLFTLLGSTYPVTNIVEAAKAAGEILDAKQLKMSVIVPANGVSGQFHTITPDGQTVLVHVPSGTGVGSTIPVSYTALSVHIFIEANYDTWVAKSAANSAALATIITDLNKQYIIYDTVKTLLKNFNSLGTDWEIHVRNYMHFDNGEGRSNPTTAAIMFQREVFGTQGRDEEGKVVTSERGLKKLYAGPELLKRKRTMNRFKFLVQHKPNLDDGTNDAEFTCAKIFKNIINSLGTLIPDLINTLVNQQGKWPQMCIFIGYFAELFNWVNGYEDIIKCKTTFPLYARRPFEEFVSSVNILKRYGTRQLITWYPLTDFLTHFPQKPAGGSGTKRDYAEEEMMIKNSTYSHMQYGGDEFNILIQFMHPQKKPDVLSVQFPLKLSIYEIATQYLQNDLDPPICLFFKGVLVPKHGFDQFLEEQGYISNVNDTWDTKDTKDTFNIREETLNLDYYDGQDESFEHFKSDIINKDNFEKLTLVDSLKVMKLHFSTADALLDEAWGVIKHKQENICAYYQSLWGMNRDIILYDYCKDPATGGRCLLLFFLREIPTSWAGNDARATINTCLKNAGFDPNSITAWDWHVRFYIYIMNTTNTEFLTILKNRGITDDTDEKAWLKKYLYSILGAPGGSQAGSPLKEYFDLDFLETLLDKFSEVDMGQDTMDMGQDTMDIGQDTNLANTPDDLFQDQLRVEEFKYILFEYYLFPGIYDASDYYRIIILSYYFDNRFYIEEPTREVFVTEADRDAQRRASKTKLRRKLVDIVPTAEDDQQERQERQERQEPPAKKQIMSWDSRGGAKSKTRKKHRKQQSNRRKHPYKRRRKSNKKRPKNKTQKTNKKRRSIKSKLRIKKRTLKKRRK